ncbi:MAG: V-type ATPase subunit [Clostridia bacterium]
MPQPSISYACGRIGVLSRNALHAAQLERLMAAHTFEEAHRTLSDIGFLSADTADFQEAADAHVKQACELVAAVTPEPQVTDCFQLRYDIHNLKVLMKSRFLAQEPQYLSSCGTIQIEKLQHAVAEHRYNALPPILKAALDKLEKQLAKEFHPMRIDAELDKALYLLIFDMLKNTKQREVRNYFVAKVDLQNYIMLLRVKAMGKGKELFRELYLPCASVTEETFEKFFDEPDRLSRLMKPYGETVYRTALTCAMDTGKLPLMEKTADDYLYGLFGKNKYKGASIEVLIAYLLRSQREATDIRLLMAGKLNGFRTEELMERLRELHG